MRRCCGRIPGAVLWFSILQMSLESDLILDRRRLKRSLIFWRTLAVIALIAGVIAAWYARGPGWLRGHVARLSISGLITEDRKLVAAVNKLADDDSVKALLVVINSPGGTVAGGESLHDAIARVAATKPVVAVMGGVAASAGYMVAVPAHRILARAATLTGSIGVLLEAPEFSGLLATIGVRTQTITSGPMKDQPSLTRPMTPEGREVVQGLVMDMYDQFVSMVAAGRHMDPAKVRELGDGRAYTGRQAVRLGLVDAIGGEQAARQWLADARKVPLDLPVEDVTTGGITERLFSSAISPVFRLMWKVVVSQGVMLDGGLALWHRPGG